MGSGSNPNNTFPLYSRVAYQKNLAYMDTEGVIYDYYPQNQITEPYGSGCAYGLTMYSPSSPYVPGWGSSMFLGGVGYGNGC